MVYCLGPLPYRGAGDTSRVLRRLSGIKQSGPTTNLARSSFLSWTPRETGPLVSGRRGRVESLPAHEGKRKTGRALAEAGWSRELQGLRRVNWFIDQSATRIGA